MVNPFHQTTMDLAIVSHSTRNSFNNAAANSLTMLRHLQLAQESCLTGTLTSSHLILTPWRSWHASLHLSMIVVGS